MMTSKEELLSGEIKIYRDQHAKAEDQVLIKPKISGLGREDSLRKQRESRQGD